MVEQVPYFFKSHRIAADPPYNWEVRHIARATSAAPTLFPPLRRTGDGRERALVDGGIFVNNPAMAAYSEARNLYPDATEFSVVSVGTGDRKDGITILQKGALSSVFRRTGYCRFNVEDCRGAYRWFLTALFRTLNAANFSLDNCSARSRMVAYSV